MKLTLRQTAIVLYASIIAAGTILSGLVIHQGSIAVAATHQLVERDLRLLAVLGNFKAEIAAIEPIAFGNYVFRDRAAFLARKRANEEAIAQGLQVLRAAFPGEHRLALIEMQYPPIRSLVGQLDEALHGSRPAPGRAFGLLRDISTLCVQINGNAEQLAEYVRADVAARGEKAERAILRIYAWVIAFSILLLLVALAGGYYARAYLAANAARRQLAMFPERNPSPVFSLAQDGSVLYANPGALDMLRRLDNPAAGPRALFPEDLPQRLAALQASGGSEASCSYAVQGRALDCRIHYLHDYAVFHAYLSDVTERKRAEERLVFLAYHDDLTGLPNRRRFFEDLAAAARGGQPGAALLLNLDRFRRITESLGPALGERVLVAAAQHLETLRPRDSGSERCELYGFEGDLFAMLVCGEAAARAVADIARRVAATAESPLRVEGRELFVTFSMGVACFPQDGTEADALVRNAESALQKALRDGGSGVQFYSQEFNARALDRLELEHELRHALARNELELHYQLQVDREGRGIGFEALARWRNPQRGMVSPAHFIPLAEETGLIVPIGEWVLRTACAQIRDWQAGGWPAMTMAINLSPRQFREKGLPALVRRTLDEYGLAPQSIELEVTESAAMQDVDSSVAMMRELKAIGVQLSIDDFGTGYSSLAYLKRFPLDKLKVDQSFVRNMADDANDAAIVRSVIALGHSLNLRVIAEGVETAQQFALLQGYDCEEMQGYLFSKPLPAPQIPALLGAQPGAAA